MDFYQSFITVSQKSNQYTLEMLILILIFSIAVPNAEAGTNRESYPLRPELIESVMYLYRATGDPYLLQIGEDMLRSIQSSAKTSCGYATVIEYH